MKIRAQGRGTHLRRTAILLIVGVCLGVGSFGGASGASPSNRTPTTDASPAGDIPDSQAFVTYSSPDGLYSVQVPEGWARTDGASGVTFTEKLNSIRIEERPAASAPTVASVRANVVIAQRLAGTVDHDRVADLLDRLGIADRASARPSELSGGETARAGLAVALANDPPVLLADEPTGELDTSTATRVVDRMRDAAERGAAVVTVTHNEVLAAQADRVIELRDGEIVT